MSDTAPKGWWVRNWKNLIPPTVGGVILLGWLGTSLVSRPSEDELKEGAAQGAAQAVMEVVAANRGGTETTEAKPAPKPYYDFLTCQGFSAEQTCQPVFAYPLTPEAAALIGFEANTAGWPNMERSRSVFTQWRAMHGVNECDLSIGIEPLGLPTADGRPVGDRKLYPTKVPGRANLLDCSPKAISAQGGVPTVGQQ